MKFLGKNGSESPPPYLDDKVTGGNLGHGELPPDPDAGLSEAEKKAIVFTLVQRALHCIH